MQHRGYEWIFLAFYRLLFSVVLILFIIVFPLWIFRAKRRKTLFKRLGWQDYPHRRSSRRPLWIHALSIGELLSAESLIKHLRRDIGDRPLYISVSTYSAFAMAAERFNGFSDGCFYFPYDVSFAVNRCLNTIDPALLVLIETDIWPGFLAEANRRKIPCLLVNGRLSPESFRTYHAFRALFQPAFNQFRGIYPQSPGESQRFLAIGVEPSRLRTAGNLKFDVALDPPDEGTLAALRHELHMPPHSPVLIAGSTHRGEEEIIRSCFLRLRRKFAGLRLVIAPRRPERGAEVLALFLREGLEAELSSHIHGPASVVVVDRMGYLSRLYAVGDIAVVGGSFVPQGGQNPIEPAACGKPVIFGPDMHDFPDISKWLLESGAAIQVGGEADLCAVCDRLLSDMHEARKMGAHGRRLVTEHQGTTTRIARDIVSDLEGRFDPSLVLR
jgi:3-deoxy-D-manno-octulosonic-acid transferase